MEVELNDGAVRFSCKGKESEREKKKKKGKDRKKEREQEGSDGQFAHL